jgi:mono/diheme cytochrome c family protein
LIRSQILLDDQHGELIQPVVRSGGQKMPPLPNIAAGDVTAIAEYLHSLAAAGRGRGAAALNVLVGSAAEGQTAFTSMCASCHSATGDLKGIGGRVGDPMALQNFWIAGGRSNGRGGGGGAGPTATAQNAKPTTVTVTLATGQKVEGTLARIDDFLVSLTDSTGHTKTFTRNGDVPKVEVHDPLDSHNQLLPKYTDKQIHDITAYLVTIK